MAAFGQANGKLQIHFIDVGQGDGALLVSPQGETVLFDGPRDLTLPAPSLRSRYAHHNQIVDRLGSRR